MHSSSDLPSARASWLHERQQDATTRFAAKTPVLYQADIDLDERTHEWATADTGSLFLTGPIGVGKTHTAWQACRLWLETAFHSDRSWQGSPVIATTRATALFDALRPDAEQDGRRLIARMQAADLLFIDDLAAARATDWTRERLFEIFDERYINCRPVVITSDVLPAQLADVVGPRVASRLAEMCRDHVVLLRGDDRRKLVQP